MNETILDFSGKVQSSKEMRENARELLEYFFEKTDGMDVSVIKTILSISLAKVFLVLEDQFGNKFTDFSENFIKLVEGKVLELKKEYNGSH